MTADVDVLLGKAYEGEALGEAFFGRLSELTDEADHRAKLDVLRRLEASTKALLAPVIKQRGITVDEEGSVRSGKQFADGASDLSWHDLDNDGSARRIETLVKQRRDISSDIARRADRDLGLAIAVGKAYDRHTGGRHPKEILTLDRREIGRAHV